MIKPIRLFAVWLILMHFVSQAQVTLSNGKHVLELSGTLSGFYNYRWMKPGEKELEKNRFNLRDAGITLEGRKEKIGYQFQMDFADLSQNLAGEVDYENPGLMDAFISYDLPASLRVTAGYTKVPYSFASLTPFYRSPFWQRAEVVRGNLFSRRDLGVFISGSTRKALISFDVGVFNGTGENALRGDNDKSGGIEFIGRTQFCWPARYRFEMIDMKLSPIPRFMIGLNGRYTHRPLPDGESFPPGSGGEFGLRMVDGTKAGAALDFAFSFKGLSLLAEIHQARLTLFDTSNALLAGTPFSHSEGFVRSGGYFAQATYYFKPIRSAFSARYEEWNINDLNPGISKRLAFAYMYCLDGLSSALKIQVTRITGEESVDPLDYYTQLRIGWQYLFR